MYYFMRGRKGEVLEQPLTRKERFALAKQNEGYVEGIIKLSFNELLDESISDLQDSLSEGLIGSNFLTDVMLEVVGIGEPDVILIKIKGLDPDFYNADKIGNVSNNF